MTKFHKLPNGRIMCPPISINFETGIVEDENYAIYAKNKKTKKCLNVLNQQILSGTFFDQLKRP